MKEQVENKKWLKKGIGYSCIQAGSIMNDLLITYLTYYATNSLFLSALSIGMLITVSKCFDGFTDIVAGALIERTRSKLGKARPYIFAGMAAYIFLIIMFSTPNLSDTGKMIWIFVAYNLDSSLFGTLFNVSKETLLRRTVIGEKLRAKVLSMTGFSMSVVGMAVGVLMPTLIASTAGSSYGWTVLAASLGVVGIVLLVIAFVLMREYSDEELQAAGVFGNKDVKKEKVNLKEQLSIILKNKYFRIYMVMYAIYALVMGFSNVTGAYYFDTNLNNLGLLSIVSLSGLITFPLFAVYPKIIEKVGSRKFGMGCMVIGIAGCLLRMAAGTNVVLLLIGNLLAGFMMVAFSVCHPIYLIDCMDYSLLKGGKQVETFYSSFTNALMKIFMGFSSMLLGMILTLGKYDGSLEVQPDSAHAAINFAYNIFPMLCAAAVFVLLYFFRVAEANEKLRSEEA